MKMRLYTAVGACVCLCLFTPGCTESVPDRVDGHFDFIRDAFPFPNFDTALSDSDLNAALAARMFGNSICASGADETCELSAAATMWVAEANETLKFGHSEGMAVLAQLMMLGQVKPSDFGGATASALTNSNGALRRELAYWGATQKVPSAHLGDVKHSAKDVLPFLAKALKDPNEAYRLLIAIRDEHGFHAGHAVVPFGYFKGTADGQYFIRIYDPNFPGTERRIEVNTRTNTWSYEGSPNPDEPRSYLGNSDNGNLLYFSPVTKRLGTLTPSFVAGFAASVSQGTVLVESQSGAVGFKDGKVVENGGTVLPAGADCFCKTANAITNVQFASSDGGQTVRVSPDAGTVFASTPTVSVRVEGSDGEGAVTISSDGKSVSYNSTGGTASGVSITTRNPDGTQTTVTVTLGTGGKGITVDTSDPKNVKVTADTVADGTALAVTTTVTNLDGGSSTSAAEGTTRAGNDIAVSVDTSTNTATVDTNVNLATCRNGVLDSMESDLDCGEYCSMQRADDRFGDGRCSVAAAQRCRNTADCGAPTAYSTGSECFQGVCTGSSCSDGRRNGAETSVDCGGGCRCPVGTPCTTDDQCQGRCVNGSCDARSTVTLSTSDNAFAQVHVSLTSLDGNTFTYSNIASPFLFATTSSFKMSVWSGSSYVVCRFLAETNANGEWVAPSAPSHTNTIHCAKSSMQVAYSSSTTGTCNCPGGVARSVAGVGTAYYLGPQGPNHPTIALRSLNSEVTISEGAAPTDINYGVRAQVGRVAMSARYDGGTAFSVDITPRSGNEGYRYEMAPGVDPSALHMPDITFSSRCSTGTQPTTRAFGPDFTLSLSCQCDSIVAANWCNADSASCSCNCGDTSGNCPGQTGFCGPPKFVAATGTVDGVLPSGTFTVPAANCGRVRIVGWGAAGGNSTSSMMFGMPPNNGGAGGFIKGELTVAPGDTFTVWVGNGGSTTGTTPPSESVGSYLGTPTNGGMGDGLFGQGGGGSGGGLTSLLHASAQGTQLHVLTIPAGGGGAGFPADPAGSASSGDALTRAGGVAATSSLSGGGGAGENGGTAGVTNEPGKSGAFGTLPSGVISTVGSVIGTPAGTDVYDYTLSCPNAGNSASGGSGCVVLRCLP